MKTWHPGKTKPRQSESPTLVARDPPDQLLGFGALLAGNALDCIAARAAAFACGGMLGLFSISLICDAAVGGFTMGAGPLPLVPHPASRRIETPAPIAIS